jgi:hypothetical protein
LLKGTVSDPAKAANEKAKMYGLSVSRVYKYALKGFAARVPSDRFTSLRNDGDVLFVSQDRTVEAISTTGFPQPQQGSPRASAASRPTRAEPRQVTAAVV